MKMYYLAPKGYGSEYFVMANNTQEAIDFISNSGEYEAEIFKGKTANELPMGYTIKEYCLGEVAYTELS